MPPEAILGQCPTPSGGNADPLADTFGLNDQSVFTEIDMDKAKYTVGMNITIVTTAKTDDEARDLLAFLGLPFATN